MTIKEIIINSYIEKSTKLNLSDTQKTDLLFDITLEFIIKNKWKYIPEGSVKSTDAILSLENPYAEGVNCFNLSDIFTSLCKEIGFDDADRFEYKYKPTSKIGQPLYEKNSKSKYRIQCFDKQYPFTDNQACFDQHCVTKVNNRFYDLVFSCSYEQEDAPYDIGPFAELVSFIYSNNKTKALHILKTSNKLDLEQTFEGKTLLHIAALSGSVKICTYLLSKGADANMLSKSTPPKVPLAHVPNNDSKLFKLLSKHTAPETVEDIRKNNIAKQHFSNAVEIIADKGNVDAFSQALKDIDINFKDDTGWSFLHWVALYNNLDIAKLLLENKADANLKNAKSELPLQYANSPELFTLLSEYTDPLVVKKISYHKAIGIIEDNGSTKEFSNIIQNLAINSTDEQGWSLLHWAAYYNNLDIAKLLLNKGANANLKDNKSLTPINYAGKKSSPMYHLLASKTDKRILKPAPQRTNLKSTESLALTRNAAENNKLLAPKTDKTIIEPSPKETNLKSTESLALTRNAEENNELLTPKADKKMIEPSPKETNLKSTESLALTRNADENNQVLNSKMDRAIIEPPPQRADLTKKSHSLNEPKLDPRNINNTPRTPEGNYPPPQKTSPSSINISMQILGGFMAVAGSAAIATAFILLNASTLGLAGLVTAGLGAASLAAGIGLFGTYNHKQAKVNEYNEAMASLAF